MPRRQPPSAVIRTLAWASLIRSLSASAENPPKTTVWAAPSRAQASIATGQLGDHRHVDRDPVALLDAELAQRVGRPADLGQEIAIGDRPRVARLADPVVGDLVAEPALHVAIDAVVGDVELAPVEPAGEREIPVERPLERLRTSSAARAPASPRTPRSPPPPRRTGRRSRWPGRRTPADGGKVRASARRFSISGCDDGSTLTCPPPGADDGLPFYAAGRRDRADRAGGSSEDAVRRGRRRRRVGGSSPRAAGPPAVTWPRSGISIPLAWKATRRRRRSSLGAAQRSVALTLPATRSVIPRSPIGGSAGERRDLEQAVRPVGVVVHRLRRPG